MAETESYQPSNGSEGDGFMEQFCYRCEKDRYKSKPCRIMGRTMAFQIGDPQYPEEWIKDSGEWPGNPRCTAFVGRGSVPRVHSSRIKDKRQNGLPL